MLFLDKNVMRTLLVTLHGKIEGEKSLLNSKRKMNVKLEQNKLKWQMENNRYQANIKSRIVLAKRALSDKNLDLRKRFLNAFRR